MEYEIKLENEKYYQALEEIRRLGDCNMCGVANPLMSWFPNLSHDEAQHIILEWISNYDELSKRYGWQ